MAKTTKPTPKDLTGEQIAIQALAARPDWIRSAILADERLLGCIGERDAWAARQIEIAAQRPALEAARKGERSAEMAERRLAPGHSRGRPHNGDAANALKVFDAESDEIRAESEAAPVAIQTICDRLADALLAGRKVVEAGEAHAAKVLELGEAIVKVRGMFIETIRSGDDLEREVHSLTLHRIASPQFPRLSCLGHEVSDRFLAVAETTRHELAAWHRALADDAARDAGQPVEADAIRDEQAKFGQWDRQHREAVVSFRGTPQGQNLLKRAREADHAALQAAKDGSHDKNDKQNWADKALLTFHELADRAAGNTPHPEIYRRSAD